MEHICTQCGQRTEAPVAPSSAFSPPPPIQPSATRKLSTRREKPLYKRWWFIVVAAIVACVLILASLGSALGLLRSSSFAICLLGGYWLFETKTKVRPLAKHLIVIVGSFVILGLVIRATETEKEKEKRVANAALRQAEQQQQAAAKAAKKAEEDKKRADEATAQADKNAKEAVAQADKYAQEAKARADEEFESALEADISIACETAVRRKLTIPKSAEFSGSNERTREIPKAPGSYFNSNAFEYKNAFNATLEATYFCTVNATNYRSTKEYQSPAYCSVAHQTIEKNSPVRI